MEPLLGTTHFRVLIDGHDVGFSDVGPLVSETTQHEQRPSFASVVLRRALTHSTELFDWRRRVAGGAEDPRDVTIQQLDGDRVVNTWRLVRARPSRWSGPAFSASGSGIAYEELELVFDDLVWESHEQGA
jgi:phage tail-like protein